ncbi:MULTISPECIES: hypothetical protein [Pseudomonas]|uniref:hypothetical protein n=1 Tax=Pseudomonas TaxID=286 RepID=UPI000937F021|nr:MULTISPECIES: hypothetical protein [Pseudomonas]AZE77313.1 hypothetical protein C4J99_1514 [Pseudomonas synxantha]OJT24107.1 hypothetical protein BOP96_25495 [Pseudomonas sp. FSL W5-0203]
MIRSNGDDSFRAYLTAGTENLEEILEAGSPFLTMMDDLDSFLNQHVSGPNVEIDNQIIHLLRINARFLLMTGFRIGLTGHVSGIFPILRTALETACYALLMSKNDSLCDIWLGRNSSSEGFKACKNAFNKPMKDAQKLVDEHDPVLGAWMYALYESTIDFGAHPNPKTVTLHTRFTDDDQGMTLIENIGLYGVSNYGYEGGLLACVEMGLATALVLSMTHDKVTRDAVQALQALNDRKNELEDMIREKHHHN